MPTLRFCLYGNFIKEVLLGIDIINQVYLKNNNNKIIIKKEKKKKENYCLVPLSVSLFFANRAAAWKKRCNFCHF